MVPFFSRSRRRTGRVARSLLSVVAASSGLFVGTLAAGAATASAASYSAVYNCTFPLVGTQSIPMTINSGLQGYQLTSMSVPSEPLSITATLNSDVTDGLQAIGATSFTGSIKPQLTYNSTVSPLVTPVALPFPRTVVPTFGTITVSAAGTTPALALNSTVGRFNLPTIFLSMPLSDAKGPIPNSVIDFSSIPCVPASGYSSVLTSFHTSYPTVTDTMDLHCAVPTAGSIPLTITTTATVPASTRTQPPGAVTVTGQLGGAMRSFLAGLGAANFSGSFTMTTSRADDVGFSSVGLPGSIPTTAVPATASVPFTSTGVIPADQTVDFSYRFSSAVVSLRPRTVSGTAITTPNLTAIACTLDTPGMELIAAGGISVPAKSTTTSVNYNCQWATATHATNLSVATSITAYTGNAMESGAHSLLVTLDAATVTRLNQLHVTSFSGSGIFYATYRDSVVLSPVIGAAIGLPLTIPTVSVPNGTAMTFTTAAYFPRLTMPGSGMYIRPGQGTFGIGNSHTEFSLTLRNSSGAVIPTSSTDGYVQCVTQTNEEKKTLLHAGIYV